MEMDFGMYKDAPLCHMFNVALQKSIKHSCATRITAKPTFIGVPALTYSGLWSKFLGAPLKATQVLVLCK